jgi:small subunit ribosomal protein S4
LPFPTDWLSVEAEQRRATVNALPDASSVPFAVNMQLVVEFYSQRT